MNKLAQLAASTKEWLYSSRRKLATGAVVALASLLAYHVVFGANGLMVYQQKRQEHTQLQLQIQSLKEQNGNLQQQNNALRNDPQAIEKEARESFGYVRKEDHVFTLPTKPAPPATAQK